MAYKPKKEGDAIMDDIRSTKRCKEATREKILRVCVKLFLEQGYKSTTMAQILEQSGVSSSSFQNIFRAKDGVLVELVKFMFSEQFGVAGKLPVENLPPVYVYAAETSIQLALTEMNENLREIYTEAYTHAEASEYIYSETAKILYRTFGTYQPELTERDFYYLEVGSAGIMRGYMTKPCTEEVPLEKKIELFLSMCLRAYCVPEDEITKVLCFIASLDIRTTAKKVMHGLFASLAMRFELA
jgi:AcrR family transcriptional regulator